MSDTTKSSVFFCSVTRASQPFIWEYSEVWYGAEENASFVKVERILNEERTQCERGRCRTKELATSAKSVKTRNGRRNSFVGQVDNWELEHCCNLEFVGEVPIKGKHQTPLMFVLDGSPLCADNFCSSRPNLIGDIQALTATMCHPQRWSHGKPLVLAKIGSSRPLQTKDNLFSKSGSMMHSRSSYGQVDQMTAASPTISLNSSLRLS